MRIWIPKWEHSRVVFYHLNLEPCHTFASTKDFQTYKYFNSKTFITNVFSDRFAQNSLPIFYVHKIAFGFLWQKFTKMSALSLHLKPILTLLGCRETFLGRWLVNKIHETISAFFSTHRVKDVHSMVHCSKLRFENRSQHQIRKKRS